MIKNRKQYLKEGELKRQKHLQSLTYFQSAAIMEQMIGSRFMLELHFLADDAPISLRQLIERKK